MKSLYGRLVITLAAIVLVSSVLGFIIANIYYQQNVREYNEKKIARIGYEIVNLYEENPTGDLHGYFTHIANMHFQLYLVDSQGNATLFGAPFREQEISPEIVQKVLDGEIYRGITAEKYGLFITGFFTNTLKNSFGLPIHSNGETYALFIRPNIEQQFGEVHILFGLLLLATFLISIIFILIYTRQLVKPIKELTNATQQLAEGNYDIHVDSNRRDEIGNLSANFKQMSISLRQLDEMRQEFVSNVSHEIQSPLTSIQGFSQAIRSGGVTDELQEQYLAIIEEESKRLSLLSKQLLTLASLEKETNLYEPTLFRLDEQIRLILVMLEPQCRKKGIEIDPDLPETYLYADKQLLSQVWINLLTNSIKFTEPGGTIYINVRSGKDVTVTITDTGIGIAEEGLTQIFERFYKVDKSRSRTNEGSGLGLSIVKEIVQRSGGRIEVNSKLEEGTSFQLTFPSK
ncbi:sensor histidine kinase [Brevibacillus daliensis]|uniref:sensor histidine kinase n=1 Tax=Brevibacillus daliensis TaxID=2892995 RepID=UPI001E3E52F5|nr:HAMP domain-containing sensor histidine kinase [Brevibacillus daliensis]